MDNINIRAASLSDLATLNKFEQGVIAAERPFDATLSDDPIQYYDIAALVNSDSAYVAVGEINNCVVACGYARIEKAKPYVNYSFYSYLGFMYVAPEHRGKGINQAIIDALSQWSIEQGITMMHLDVFAENNAAIRAYQKAGFRSNLVEMRKEIGS